jgi:hypothetical protein
MAEADAGGAIVTKADSARRDPTRAATLTTIFEEGRGRAGSSLDRRDRLRGLGRRLRGFAEDAGLIVESVAGDYGMGPLGPGSERAILLAVKP